MKFSCTQENINLGLSLVSHVSGKNISLPILNNVLLRTENKNIKLATTNLEIGISCLIRGKVEKEGEFTVDSKLLSDYVSLLPRENVTMELTDQKLKVNCGSYKTVMHGQEAGEFPLIPKIDRVRGFSIPIMKFRQIIQQTIFAVSYSETRPEISGVYLKVKDDKLVVAATDSYRLAEKRVSLEKRVDFEEEVIIPAKTLQELSRILANFQGKKEAEEQEEKGVLEIFFSENQVLFNFDQVELVSRVIEGQYPDYKQIIPDSHKTKLIISTAALNQATKAASLFTKSGINDITLSVDKGKFTISSQNTLAGENTVEVDSDVEGEDNKIILNYRYLLDGLNSLNVDEITLQIADNNTPCIIIPKGGDKDSKSDYQYLIMPIRQ